MSTKLNRIKDWPELAKQANYCAATLAKQQGVSLRALQRFFKEAMGKSPKKWLAEERQVHGMKVLQGCSCIKETATNLGYKHTHHFSRDFKAHWGYCPAEMLARQTPNP